MSWRRYTRHRRRLAQFGLLLLLLGLPVAAGFSLLSAIDYTMLRQLPYPRGDDLYRLRQRHPAYPGGAANFSAAQVEEIRELLQSADLVTSVRAGAAASILCACSILS